jgi:hypothetical protein
MELFSGILKNIIKISGKSPNRQKILISAPQIARQISQQNPSISLSKKVEFDFEEQTRPTLRWFKLEIERKLCIKLKTDLILCVNI